MLLGIIVGASLLQIIAAEGSWTTIFPPTCPLRCQPQEGPKGFPGMNGMKGSMGDKGATGPHGKYPPWWHWHHRKGVPGPPGSPGKPGERGYPGCRGEKGRTGSPGRPGSPGQKGDTGPGGREGITGLPGDPGFQGDQGPPGDRGDKGMQGRKGMEGIDGTPGIEGAPGERGDFGNPGDEGDPGPRGSEGPKGVKGDMGEQGHPATGGQEVMGPKGDKGVKGEKGEAGEKGDTGETGDPGEMGPNIRNESSVLDRQCNEQNEGEIYHDATTREIVFCDGDQWKCAESAPCDCIKTSYRVRDVPKPSAADVVLIVDDSRSMINAQDWIPSAAEALEASFQSEGIGSGTLRNKYYVVLFANLFSTDINDRAKIVEVDGNAALDVSQVGAAMSKFSREGNQEDGYEAIELALTISELRQRNDVALNLLLITDEPRDPITEVPDFPPGIPPGTDSSLEIVREKLLMHDATLNVLFGNVQFESNVINDIIAVDYKGVVYSSGGSSVDTVGFTDSSINVTMKASDDTTSAWEKACREFVQYAPLAMSTGGAVWNMKIIDETIEEPERRQQFTEDLAHLKLREVSNRSVCAVCNVTSPRCLVESGSEQKDSAESCSVDIDQTYCQCRASGKSHDECDTHGNLIRASPLQSRYNYSPLYSECRLRHYPSIYKGWCDRDWPFGEDYHCDWCGYGDSAWRYKYDNKDCT